MSFNITPQELTLEELCKHVRSFSRVTPDELRVLRDNCITLVKQLDEEIQLRKDGIGATGSVPGHPSPTTHVEDVKPTEYKVGSWGAGYQNKRVIRKIMADNGIWFTSTWRKGGGHNQAMINSLKSIKPGDIFHMCGYQVGDPGFEYRGIVESKVMPLTREIIRSNYRNIWDAAWGDDGPKETNDHFKQIIVSWKRISLTLESEKGLRKLVTNGGKCTEQRGTIIKLA